MRSIILLIILFCNINQFTFGQSEEKKLKLLTGVSLISPDSNTTYFNLDLGINQYKWKDDYDSLKQPFFRFTNTSVYTNVMFIEKPVMGLHYNFLGGGFIKAGLMSLLSIGGDVSIMTNFQEISFVIQPEIGISIAEYGKISVGPSINIGKLLFQSPNQVFSTVKIHIYHHTLKKKSK